MRRLSNLIRRGPHHLVYAASIQGTWQLSCIQFAQLTVPKKNLTATCLSYHCNKPVSYQAVLIISGWTINVTSSGSSSVSSSSGTCPTTSSIPPLNISRSITGVSSLNSVQSGSQSFPDGSQCFSLGSDASLILSLQCVGGGPQLQVTGVKSTPDGKDLFQSQCYAQSNKVASLPATSIFPNSAKLFCTSPSSSTKGSYNYQCVGFPLFS